MIFKTRLQENDWGCIPEVVSDRKGFRGKYISGGVIDDNRKL